MATAPVIAPVDGPPIDAAQPWGEFWRAVESALIDRGYAASSIAVYRQVLRGFYRFWRCSPSQVTTEALRRYLYRVVQSGRSVHWLAQNVCVLRTVFDKLCGLDIAHRIRTPKRGCHLPEILSPDEANSLIEAASCARDQLLLALVYGTGLRPAEALSLRWGDLDVENGHLTVRRDGRIIPLPSPLRAILEQGHRIGDADGHVFPGRHPQRALSRRCLERIVRHAARRVGLHKPVTPMTLRHSFAVYALEQGANERVLQEQLGHRHIGTTLRYRACIPGSPPRVSDGHRPLRSALTALWETIAQVEPATVTPLTRSLHLPVADRLRFFYRSLRTRFFRLLSTPLRR